MKKNLALTFLVIISAAVLAIPFANLIVYTFITAYYGSWVLTKGMADFVNGAPFIYLLLSPIVFGIWGVGRKWVWSVFAILPILFGLLYIEADNWIWLWSLGFFIFGAVIANIVNLFKNRSKIQIPSKQ